MWAVLNIGSIYSKIYNILSSFLMRTSTLKGNSNNNNV